MGLFSKKKEDQQSKELNELLNIALNFDQASGTWSVLPSSFSGAVQEQVINTRKMIFEYIRQLKEAGYYSNGAVQKFSKEQYPWVNKDNIQKFIALGKSL